MNRWNLAVAGTVGVGAVVLAAWFFLLPYTMGTTSSPSFLLELRQRWNDSRGRAPETPTLQPLMAEVRAQAAAKPGQKVVVDSTHSFSLVVPATWAVVSQADGKVELVSASTTLKFLYPAATTEVLAGATTTASELDGAPAFKDLPVFLPAPVEPNTRHAYHLYTLLLDLNKLNITRDQFLEEMTKNNIGVGVHFRAVHLHPYYQKRFKYRRGAFPNADWISERTVSLPLSPKLSAEDVNDVIMTVTKILTKHAR